MKKSYTLILNTNAGKVDFSKTVEGHEDSIDDYATIEYNRAKKRAHRIIKNGYFDESVQGKTTRKRFYTYKLIDEGVK